MRIRKVNSAKANVYWEKAKEFYETMLETFNAGRWNSAGLEGVHCAISVTDALLAKKVGLRSIGKSHFDVLELVIKNIKDERASEQVERLRKIINKKNLVEYEDREFSQKEAESLVKDVERYFNWVKSFFVG